MQSRDLGSAVLTGNNFSDDQELILQLVALVAASISIIAGVFSLYWFFRIKTYFRHQLVTFLICSDLFKAIWFFVSAAFAVRLNPDEFSNSYCQASGFFLSFAIEASDYAILVIAIHSALCIFRPNTNLGETGLYSIRYLVYTLWIAMPLLAAGLGLINDGVYVSSGAFCWLPIRPFWYRLALSWIPRYLIIAFIISLYASIYIFVAAKFKDFHTSTDTSYKQPSASDDDSKSSKAVLQHTSDVAYRTDKPGDRSRTQSCNKESFSVVPESSIPAWENFTFGSSTIPLSGPARSDITAVPSQVGTDSINKASVSTQYTVANDFSHGEVHKSLAEFLKEEPPAGKAPSPPQMNPMLVTEEVFSETKARQRTIKRQLRFMFIYPVFYLISWIPPLVQHFTLYNDEVATHPNFGLACTATCFMALQCAIDSAIFSCRERPWRLARKNAIVTNVGQKSNGSTAAADESGSFVPFRRKDEPGSEPGTASETNPAGRSQQSQSTIHTSTPRSSLINRLSYPLRRSTDTESPNRLSGHSGGFFSRSAGRSKGEMIAEARVARQRRENEAHSALEMQEERQRARKKSFLRRDGADRSWWDVEGRRRKDSVLLGLDMELSKSKGREESVTSPGQSVRSGLFSPWKHRSSVSNTPSELSPKSWPLSSMEKPDLANSDGLLDDRNTSGTGVTFSPLGRDIQMPILEEEEGIGATQDKSIGKMQNSVAHQDRVLTIQETRTA